MKRLVQSLIGIPLALRNGEMFVSGVVEIGDSAHGSRGIGFPPTDDVEKTMEFKSEFNPPFVLYLRPQTDLIRIHQVRQESCRNGSQAGCCIIMVIGQ